MSGPTIFLDPGHGGISPLIGLYVTPGKRAHHDSVLFHRNGWFYEGVFNRSFCRALEQELKAIGINVIYTVPESALWADTPLADRVNYANHISSQMGLNSLFLSIHANWFKNSEVTGYELFTSPGQTESDLYADLAYLHLKELYTPFVPRARQDYSDGDADKEAYFYVLTKTEMAAALFEAGFMSNREEAIALFSPLTQATGARSLAMAAAEFFAQK